MIFSKGVVVNSQDIKNIRNHEHDLYAYRSKIRRENVNYESKDFSCQYNNKRDNVICCCRRREESKSYFNTSHQVYRSQRYARAWGFTDVGVGSVKTVPRKRVKRIYLPDTEDRGVGSSDLTSFIRRRKYGTSYYDQKKTSSKCVGGVIEYNNKPVLSEKLSPICRSKSGSTSPIIIEGSKANNKRPIKGDPVVNVVIGKKQIKSDKIKAEQGLATKESHGCTANFEKTIEVPNTSKFKPAFEVLANKDFSSDSLVQHVHNLEDPSLFKHSRCSMDLLENGLEKEYIKMFPTKSKNSIKPVAEVKPIQDCNSMRKRFAALRYGVSKRVSKEHGIIIKSSSHNSVPSKHDVSITSDPPSLEARSYTNTKLYIPPPSHEEPYEDVAQTSYRNSGKESIHWSTDNIDSDYQNVKGMFKLWGQKFNLEEDYYNKSSPYKKSSEIKKKKKVEIIVPNEEDKEKERKERKKFSFFRRNNKNKSKQTYKSKKRVTAGRCEVGDGLMIKIGAVSNYSETSRNKSKITRQECDDILRKVWMQKLLDNKYDSRNSVNIRWNNDMYATSSSTVFELMECIYKNTGIDFRSKSETIATTAPTAITDTLSYLYQNQQVNFMQQTIQAWMMPKLITDNTIKVMNSKNNKNIEITFSNQTLFIKRSKTFSQKIELVLQSKNCGNIDHKSSEYIVIDIPNVYFSESNSEDEVQHEVAQSSDEQVYNIVEYLTAKSSSYLRKKRVLDPAVKDICVTVNLKENESNDSGKVIQTPPLLRDVILQGSNVYVPKRCDVIGVGIITQHTHNRDLQDIKEPRLNMQDEITDDESRHTIAPQKKCELAESYLQDYYRHLTSLGIDLYSSCVNDYNLRGSSDNDSLKTSNNQSDSSKFCSNVHDDNQIVNVLLSSSETASSSHSVIVEERKNIVDDTTTYFNKFKKNDETELQGADGKRVLPKDSVEVFKRRKIYAKSKKVGWCASNEELEPCSVSNILDKCAQEISNESSQPSRAIDTEKPKPTKKCIKRVSLKDLEKKIGDGILSFKGSFGSGICKKNIPCSKNARVNPEPETILVPPCKDTCQKKKKPPCSKHGSPTCLVLPPVNCPAGSPSPCVPACPPIAPPCAPYLAEISTSPLSPPKHRKSSRHSATKWTCPSPTKSPPAPPTEPTVPKPSSSLLRCPLRKSHSKTTPSSPRKPPSPPKSPSSPPKSPSSPIKSCSSLFRWPLRQPQSKSPPSSRPSSPPTSPPSKSYRSFLKCSLHKSQSKLPTRSPPKSPPKSPPATPPKSPPPKSRLSLLRCPLFRKKSSQSKQTNKNSPPCMQSCEKKKKPPCSKKNSPSCFVPVPPICPAGPHSPCQPPCPPIPPPCAPYLGGKPSRREKAPQRSSSPPMLCPPCCTKSLPQKPSPKSSEQFIEPCGCNPQRLCGLPQCPSTKKTKMSPKNSGLALKKPESSKLTNAFKRFSKKCTSMTNNDSLMKMNTKTDDSKNDLLTNKDSKALKKYSSDCDSDCPKKAKEKRKGTEKEIGSPYSSPSFCPPTKRGGSQPKMSGLHLKMKPRISKSANECQPNCSVIKLNSKENITIRMKPTTPSTEEIREDRNIKVQDEDGITLYERRDYKTDTAQTRKYLVKDMYRDSQIHRVATSNAEMITNKQNLDSSESNVSLSNIVEINLNLKFKRTDKTREVNVNTDTSNNYENGSQASLKEVYVMQDKINKPITQIEAVEKKDFNIKIIINKYQPGPKSKGKIKNLSLNTDDAFSRKISEKFHTVSTGYSDVLDQQTYSVHRATVNFTDSTNISKHNIKPSLETDTEEVIELEPINLADDEIIIKHSTSEQSIGVITAKSEAHRQVLHSDISQITSSKIDLENLVDSCVEKSTTDKSVTGTDETLSDIPQSSVKLSTTQKKLLKQIFESSNSTTNTQNKSKMRTISNMLRAVLTSDCGEYEDVPSNELANELTYESLKPNFFKDIDSMTNYYQYDSSTSDKSKTELDEILYPTEIENSTDSELNENTRCLCTQLAAKLNISANNQFKPCCCSDKAKNDEEIDCNLTENVSVMNRTGHIDVETQDSLKSKSKLSSTSIASNTEVLQPQKVSEKDKKLYRIFDARPQKMFSYQSSVETYPNTNMKQQTVLALTEDDKEIFLKSKSYSVDSETRAMNVYRKYKTVDPIDIFQHHETKKAVLEIYAEKTLSNKGEHLVAKLPKFVYDIENEIYNFENMLNSVKPKLSKFK